MGSGSAPAKIILFGEHAVVHGVPALAAPVSTLRATAFAEPAQPGYGIRLETPSFIAEIPADININTVDDALALTILLTLKALAMPYPDLVIRLDSTIPIASGMGSGAAVSTALARALCAHFGITMPPSELNAIIYEVEKLHHGTPSGIDNTVIVYETPVLFRRGHVPEPLQLGAPLSLLIGDTGHPSSTKLAVEGVWALRAAEPERTQSQFARIGQIIEAARQYMQAGEVEAIGHLMNENHIVLRELTVSSVELDHLVQAALDAGTLGAKLSGGGRGGIMIALVTPETQAQVKSALMAAGAVNVYATTIV